MKLTSILLISLLLLSACNPVKEETAKNTTVETTQETAPQTETIPTETTTETKTTAPVETSIEETQKTETTKPAQTIAETTPTKTAEEILNTEEITEEPAKSIRTKMYQFLDTFAQDVKSYGFTYKKDKYAVKDQKVRIQLYNPVTVNDVTFGNTTKLLFYYDVVYVDRAQKTAFAYCEGHNSQVNKQCAELEIYDLMYPVTYSEYNKPLPEDWLYTYLDQEPSQIIPNKYYVGGRATTTVIIEGTPDLELSFDPMTGLVLRADQKKGEQLITRYDYEQLAHNTVREVDVNHRTKSEIPSSEAFYIEK